MHLELVELVGKGQGSLGHCVPLLLGGGVQVVLLQHRLSDDHLFHVGGGQVIGHGLGETAVLCEMSIGH